MNLMEESDSSSELLFSELKGYCLQLLHLLQNPNLNSHNNNNIFNNLVAFIRQSSPHHLLPFFDYTLFPFVLLLEAAVECRNNPPPPPKISDYVAEGMLHCLEHLLIKCHVPSLDQMVVLLKNLTNAALISPSQVSEEFREGVIRCFKALLNGLCFCSNSSCECKKLKSIPMLIDDRYTQSSFPVHEIDIEECLLAFLRSPSVVVTVGNWLSLL